MRLAITGNPEKPQLDAAVQALIAILRQRDVPFVLSSELQNVATELGSPEAIVAADQLHASADVVIAFGGDGTMLAVSRILAGTGIPLLGVNLGRLGFLAEFPVESLDHLVEDLLNGHYTTTERSMLSASFPDHPDLPPLIAVNDIVVDKHEDTLMLQLDAYVDGDYLGSYSADGLIVATPTGSTAYALAVGGPIVAPNAAVCVVAPIAPHMLTARPVVLADSSVIAIHPQASRSGQCVRVFADGQNRHIVPLPATIRVSRYTKTICLVKIPSRTYFDVLRAKLLWGREPVLQSDIQSNKH